MIANETDIFQNGERFHGYVVERLLGKGGLGAVYLVRHEMLDTLYALKVLYPEVAAKNPVYIKRFLREAKIAKIGYRTRGEAAMPAEYTPTSADERLDAGLGIDLDKLPQQANDTLSFETEDEEVQALVARLKRRRLKEKLAFAPVVAALALMSVLLLVLSKG